MIQKVLGGILYQ